MLIQTLIFFTLLVPLAIAGCIWFLGSDRKTVKLIHIGGSILFSGLAFSVVVAVSTGAQYFLFSKTLLADALGGVFLLLIALTGLLINLYSVKYMEWERESGHLQEKDITLFFALSHLFIFTMSLSVLANNIAVMWAAIEATTLSSVFMVAVQKGKRSTESGWKYVVICSVGLAFAMYATILLYGAGFSVIKDGQEAMLWSSLKLHADAIDPDALKLIFIFALVGFGTKAGLAPMHTWLPDVHSEGPSPASAMLSAVLLKCAFLAIARYYSIAGSSSLGFGFVETIMMVVALVTIFVAALFILRQHDIKRMFAYHSVEHLGIVAFGFGVGGPLGIFAGLFHTLTHSITKALAFCVSGNIIRIYGTRDMRKMGGLVKLSPKTAILFGIAICSLVGIPLFAIFVSEFLAIKAAIGVGKYLAVTLFIIGLAIIFVGVFSHFNLVMFGQPKGEVQTTEIENSATIPLVLMAAAIILIGVVSFEGLMTLFGHATAIIYGS